MIVLPDRLSGVADAIAAGEDVDFGRVLQLQALDIAIVGEQFVAEQLQRQEEADETIRQLIAAGR